MAALPSPLRRAISSTVRSPVSSSVHAVRSRVAVSQARGLVPRRAETGDFLVG
jgi:hypothetical protein